MIPPKIYFDKEDYQTLSKDSKLSPDPNKMIFISDKFRSKFINQLDNKIKYDLNNNNATSRLLEEVSIKSPENTTKELQKKLADTIAEQRILRKASSTPKDRQKDKQKIKKKFTKPSKVPTNDQTVQKSKKSPKVTQPPKLHIPSVSRPMSTAKKIKKASARKDQLIRARERGDHKLADEMENDDAWKNTILKASGFKTLPDVDVLEKKIKLKQKRKEKSAKQWEERNRVAEETRNHKMAKRSNNIKQRGHGRC